jgi:hypothetical protein
VIADEVAIEVKTAERVSHRDCKGLLAFAEEVHLQKRIVVSAERLVRKTDQGVLVMPLQEFLRDLWEGRLFDP